MQDGEAETMKTSFLSNITLLAFGVSAAPRLSHRTTNSTTCLTSSTANKVANNFKYLINLPFDTTLAQENMTVDFHDYSDSVNELINAGSSGPNTLGQATFNSRAEFIDGQSAQPTIPFEILNLWHTCSTIIMRWRSSSPGTVTPEQVVTGIVVIEAVANSDVSASPPWLMQTVYSEFNSGAWLYDLGNFTPSCTEGGLPVSGGSNTTSSAVAAAGSISR